MRLVCTIASCRAENDAAASACQRCGTPLRAYARLLTYPALLFNEGLVAAREGRPGRARECFAAVVAWCPADLEARNALAMACYAAGDLKAAHGHWQQVLARSAGDALAVRGMAALASRAAAQAKALKVVGKGKHRR